MEKTLPPGPRGHFLLGVLPEFRRDLLGLFSKCAREYGDVVRLRIPNMPSCLLSHPDHIEYVLVTANKNFKKHKVWRHLSSLFGNGLLTSEGDFWLRQRRLAQPAFHRAAVATYGDVMVEHTQRMLESWQDGQTRDVHQDMMNLTLQIVAKTLFHADVAKEASDVGKAMEEIMAVFVERFRTPIFISQKIPTPSNRRFTRAVRRLDDIIYGIIGRRRSGGQNPADLLGMLLHAQDEDGSRMTDQQLRDEAINLFLAGHETTAIALSWTWYLLSQDPETETKLAEELQRVLGGRTPAVADLPQLHYTERVVMESMRLYPPAYAFGREALSDCEIGGYRIPAGTTLFISQWIVHHDPRFFETPDAFNPDRWGNDLVKRIPKFAYFPFGGGPRLCIGNNFAMMEAVLLLATIAQKFRLSLLPDHPVVPQPSITLRPKYGMKVVLSKR